MRFCVAYKLMRNRGKLHVQDRGGWLPELGGWRQGTAPGEVSHTVWVRHLRDQPWSEGCHDPVSGKGAGLREDNHDRGGAPWPTALLLVLDPSEQQLPGNGPTFLDCSLFCILFDLVEDNNVLDFAAKLGLSTPYAFLKFMQDRPRIKEYTQARCLVCRDNC